MKQTMMMLLDEMKGWGSEQPTPLGAILPIETPLETSGSNLST